MAKLKYRISDGEILAWGFMPDLRAGPGEMIEDTNQELKPGMIRVSANNYRNKTQPEQDASDVLNKRFNEASFIAWINSAPTVDEKLVRLTKTLSKLSKGLKEQDVK